MKTPEKSARATHTAPTHTVLYRKYRPHTFADVIGQDHVVDTLQAAAKAGKIAHAYLFTGSRGTGKTSVARIFAEIIGCSANDLYEIDGASNRGIDDVRALREAVHTLPFESPYKVYIIDEVHMLTKEAFNALLKTLEEPPAHAVFILATTELEKVPETVVSRCQVFYFKKPTLATLKEVVLAIAKKEGYTIEPASAELIALLGDGSFRDTQGMLQKVLSASADKKISPEEVERVAGAPRGELVNDFVRALAGVGPSAASDESVSPAPALAALAKVSKSAGRSDMTVFLKLVLYKVRLILLLRYAPDMEKEIAGEVSEGDLIFIKEMAKITGPATTTSPAPAGAPRGITPQTVLELMNASGQIGQAFIPSLPIELAVVRLLG